MDNHINDPPVDLKVHRISKALEPLLELRANLDIIKDEISRYIHNRLGV